MLQVINMESNSKKRNKRSSYCCVPTCYNCDGEGISFHCFPSDEKLKKHWETLLNLQKPASRFGRVCSDHFVEHDFFPGSNRLRRRLKKNAIPSLKFPNKENNSIARISDKKMLKNEAKHIEANGIVECRACLQKCREGEIYKLFQCWEPPWSGMENTVAEDLIKLTNIQIFETDKHSKVLCHYCYKMLQKANNFIQIVRKTDEVLKLRCLEDCGQEKYWPKPIQIDKNMENLYDDVKVKEEVVSDEEYNTHMNGTDQVQDYPKLDIKIEADDWEEQGPVRINGSISLSQLNAEMARLNESPIPPPCSKGEGTENVNGVVNGKGGIEACSLDTKIKEEPPSEDDDENGAPDLPLECLLCTKTFLSISGLKAHVITQHSYKTVKRKHSDSSSGEIREFQYTCSICQRRFETSTDLMVHETCHNKSVCYGCNASFDTFDLLTDHRRSCKAIAESNRVGRLVTLEDVKRPNVAQLIELKCPHCTETFTDAYYMDIHLDIHHPSNEPSYSINSEEENMEIEALETLLGET